MLRIPALGASLALVVAGLGGCALLEDVGDGDLDDALELVPEDATVVTFTHRQATAERLGIDDVATGDDREAVDRYRETVVEADLAGVTRFGGHLTSMTKRAAFSELDIVWEAAASAEGQPLGRVYKMRDDLDLDAVGDDLVDAGYEEDEIAGHRHLFIEDMHADLELDGTIGGYPGVEMPEVVVVPDERLMFVGGTAEIVEAAVGVFEDDADSATDGGGFDDVLDGADDPELALLRRDVSCEDVGVDGLGTPEATGFYVSGEGPETSSVLAFADDDAAEADLAARRNYLADGVLLATREAVADVAEWDIEQDGNLVRIDYAYDDPGLARGTAETSDGFHACHPE
ncbi:MAG: hypothetical protein M3237_02230 [Actinomycetota bacterium]|nr:hypothetical protein [Actinomycetota bacterium]